MVFKALLDFLSNRLRLLVALAFLASFAFRPVIQPFVFRLLQGIIVHKKLPFTTRFQGSERSLVLPTSC
jgi:hypothetical protein